MKKMQVAVTPQWAEGKKNLGEKSHKIEAFATFAEMAEVADANPKLGEVMVDLVNRWAPVVGGGRYFKREVMAKMPARGRDEGTEAYMLRTHEPAKREYQTHGQLPDIIPLLAFIAENARGSGEDATCESIRSRWNAPDANAAAKRERLAVWGGDPATYMDADAEEVVALYKEYKMRSRGLSAL